MGRAIWKGSIQFGLVTIPVELRSATARDDVKLSWLDKHDLSPVGYERVNKSTGKPVAWEDIVKGVKRGKEMVVLTEEELDSVDVEATQTVDIREFVDLSEIEPVYFERPYYLAPAGAKKKTAGASKGYVLLRNALEKTGKAGIGTVVIRQRQHLAAVLVRGHVLVLEVLRFPEELRSPDEVDVPKLSAAASAAEVRMAEKLVSEMSGSWDPDEYHDTYREQLLEMVERKAKSGETQAVAASDRRGSRGGNKVVDLMSLLKRSLEERRDAKPTRRAHAGTKRTARKTRTRRTERTRRSA